MNEDLQKLPGIMEDAIYMVFAEHKRTKMERLITLLADMSSAQIAEVLCFAELRHKDEVCGWHLMYIVKGNANGKAVNESELLDKCYNLR